MQIPSKLLILFAAAIAFTAQAEVKVAPIFNDNMVLQRDRTLPVWGKADPGENVTVTFAGETKSAAAGKDGKWRVDLSPKSANTAAQEMTVKGASNTITIKNILVGEVWLCSGQSNMEMPLWSGRERWRTIDGDKAAANCDNPMIRTVKVRPYGWSPSPVDDIAITWEPLTEENALNALSAAAFYFGTRIQPEIGVPVGLITSHWGGTAIEPWTPLEGFDTVEELRDMLPRVRAGVTTTQEYRDEMQKIITQHRDYQAKVEAALSAGELPPAPPEPSDVYSRYFKKQNERQTPVYLYNRMIYPLVPFALRGAIWYQGCANRGDGFLYQHKMQALLNGWRKVFENPDMSFYFAQLAPYSYGKPEGTILTKICLAQERFAQANCDNKVAMIVLNDHGNYNDIHPANKKVVGHRFANLALKYDYGRTDLKAESPRFVSCTPQGSELMAEFANVERFTTKGNFEEFMLIAGKDGVFYPAKIRFEGNRMYLSSPSVAEPQQVRYLWKNCSEGRIFNEAGLPLGIFHHEIKPEVEGVPSGSRLLYTYDVLDGTYLTDTRTTDKSPFQRILYYVESLDNRDNRQWAAVSMDAFTGDASKLGLPDPNSGIIFQTKVKNLTVESNVASLEKGNFSEGNIEIWPNNYKGSVKLNLNGATSGYDFDDTYTAAIGYGSFQVHNFQKKQTVFAINNWKSRNQADFGYGNCTFKNPDWTFAQSARNYKMIKVSVYLCN